MNSIVRPEKLDLWIAANMNVLISGKHGIGKTAVVKAAFDRCGLKTRYFSGSTLDPWVDFVGVPRVKVENGIEFLELVRPHDFAEDEVEAIFIDEYNRAPKKVRNAVMELIQFKSINGHKFKNLRVVWAAINPDDELKYDVEDLDPAQIDRFQICVKMPYLPDGEYFTSSYDSLGKAALQWWDELPEEQKNIVSPRRLEYAIQAFNLGCDVADIVDVSCNVTKLKEMLRTSLFQETFDRIERENDVEGFKKIIKTHNGYEAAMNLIIKSANLMNLFLHHIGAERLMSYIYKEDKIMQHVVKHIRNVPFFELIGARMFASPLNPRGFSKFKSLIRAEFPDTADEIYNRLSNYKEIMENSQEIKRYYNSEGSLEGYQQITQNLLDNSEFSKNELYLALIKNIPEKMNVQEIENTFAILKKVLKNNRQSTLTSYPNLIETLYHLYLCARECGLELGEIESRFKLDGLRAKLSGIDDFKSKMKVFEVI